MLSPTRVVARALASLLVALSLRSAPAQELIHEVSGTGKWDLFGFAARGLSDLDGDGVREFAVGAPDATHVIHAFTGAFKVFSGKTFAELYTVWGPTTGDSLGNAIELLNDLNSDGVDDLVVGAPAYGLNSYGFVSIFGGKAGGKLRTIRATAQNTNFGIDLAVLGDLDGDGDVDFVAGEPGMATNGTRSGRISAWSSGTGTLLWSVLGASADLWFGFCVEAIEDLDGDGVRDVIVGAPARTAVADPGRAYVYSGANGAFLLEIDGLVNGDNFGFDVAAIGDQDGDGLEDLLIGAQLDDAGGVDVGAAYIYSSATLAPLWTRTGTNFEDAYGWRVADVGDVNGDGRRDYAIGAVQDDHGADDAGIVDLFSGASRERLYRFQSTSRRDWLGAAICGLGDLDGDGFGDLLVGVATPTYSTVLGRARVYAGNDLFTCADPQQAAAHAPIEIAIREGTPSRLLLCAAVDVDGSATFLALFGLDAFDATGAATYADTVPPGVSGHTVDLQTFALDANGKLIASAAEHLTLR